MIDTEKIEPGTRIPVYNLTFYKHAEMLTRPADGYVMDSHYNFKPVFVFRSVKSFKKVGVMVIRKLK